MYRRFFLIPILAFGLSLSVYPQAYPQAKSKAPAKAPQNDEPPVLAVPPGYKYDARGRRDPFVNPVPKAPTKAAAAAAPVVRPPGLKGVLVSEAAITGVVTSREPSMNVVVISAPGGKTYFGHVGDALFDGVVKDIRLDTVTFVVTAVGANGQSPREIVRKVRPAPGENR